MANTAALLHEALRNLPVLACDFHLNIQDGSSIHERFMTSEERETPRRRERNTPKRDEVCTSLL